jgi:[protein-PII] uridylyltransferase
VAARTPVVTDGAELRRGFIEDGAESGGSFCRRLAAITDDWVRELHDAARAAHPRAPRIALLAIGGYGRGELAPFSDLDILLVHASRPERVESIASAIWYPIWDAGCILGHSVRSVEEQTALARRDLDTATALLTARHVAGDARLAAEVIAAGADIWHRRRRRYLDELRDRVRTRQREAGDVAYMLEPDLKDGHGGLRDVQSLWWAERAGLTVRADDRDVLEECYETLLGARVALHRSSGRRGEVLRLEDQDAAASRGGHRDADALMAEISAAARTIAWIADETWGRLGRVGDGRPSQVAPGVDLVEGEVELAEDADPAVDPTLVLRVAQVAARRRARIGRRSLDRLTAEVPEWPERWPAGAVDELVALLLEGHAAIPVLESLDQRSLIERILPEWAPVRSRPQRNAYHRFTVDRHLWEAAANAAELAGRVTRPDLLVLGALFHDIGKGYPGDHTEVGMRLVAERLAPRMGIGEADTAVLVAMVEHHLLLPDVAMRRDLSDPATIEQVAAAVGDPLRLELLDALTEADSIATGPAAWGSWKEGLVRDLVAKVGHVLGGGAPSEVAWRLFPDAATLERMASGTTSVTVEGDRLTVVTPDVPGVFSRVAGVLALNGLDVLSAQAHSDEPQGGRAAMAASQFLVSVPKEGVDWGPVEADLLRALSGGLAIEARLAERARTYRRRRVTQAHPPGPPRVVFDDGASSNATVIEVHCSSKMGVLHRITKALADLGLDIRHATVQTVGMQVIDTFYVRTRDGGLLTDAFHRAEVERAVLHVVG